LAAIVAAFACIYRCSKIHHDLAKLGIGFQVLEGLYDMVRNAKVRILIEFLHASFQTQRNALEGLRDLS
jgi:hypothetical protein